MSILNYNLGCVFQSVESSKSLFSGVLVTQLPSLSPLVLTFPGKNINVGIPFWRFKALYKYSAFLCMTF